MHEDNYFHLYQSIEYRICLVISTTICLTLGLGLHLVVIHFEKFGGDPKKRCVSNQLISVSCHVFILLSVLSFSAANWRTLIGPLSVNHARFSLLTGHWLVHFIIFTSMQILCRKCLKLVFDWSFLNRVDDDWLALFLTCLNLILAAIAVVLKVRTGEIVDYDFYLLTGLSLKQGGNSKFGFPVKNASEG